MKHLLQIGLLHNAPLQRSGPQPFVPQHVAATTGHDVTVAYMYILECSDRTLYVGSTRNLEGRLWQHQVGEGAIYTQTRLPVRLIYFEQYDRVDAAFRREKQVQGWSRAKRLALVHGKVERLPGLSRKRFT